MNSSKLARIFFILCLFLIPFPSQAQEEAFINLDQLVAEALRANPDIAAAKRKWDASKERIPQARALPDPMAGFGIINLPTSFSFTREDMTMKEISASQKVPFFGKRRLAGEIAEKEAELTFNEIQDRVNRVIRDVKSSYFDLSHVYRTTRLTGQNLTILETFARIAETKYAVGSGIQQDVLKAHVEVSRMINDLIALRQSKRALSARLIALLNRPPGGLLGEPEEVILKKFPINIEELQKTAADNNPTLLGLKRMIESREKAYELAKREYYPDFNFRVAYGQRDNAPGGVERQDMVTGMVEINVPLYFGVKQDRRVAETKADIMNAQSQYRAARNEIFSLVTDAAAAIQQRELQYELYSAAIIPQARLQVSSAMAAYQVNKVDFLTLLDSQSKLYQYEIEFHQVLTEYEKSVANLEALVGKQLLQRAAEFRVEPR